MTNINLLYLLLGKTIGFLLGVIITDKIRDYKEGKKIK